VTCNVSALASTGVPPYDGATVSEQQNPAEGSLGIAIAHLALKQGLITPEQLREALSEQSRGTLRSLDAILVARGWLTQSQLNRIQAMRETTVFPASPPADPAWPVGQPETIGKYRILREAGRGAMAKVYEALDTELQRKVAVKVLISSPNAQAEESAIEEQRFLREARLCAALPKHPSIVGVYDAGVVDGRRYLAMEFIQGMPMDRFLKNGTVTLGRPTALLRDVALAVHHAHENGVIHRDLKPANILVDADSRPHVMDFGLAKMAGQNILASYTEGGLAVGTPAYMSPEQASGSKEVDRRSDIYAMGVMLYEILTGKLPFVGATPMEVMVKTSKDPVVPPSKITSFQINPVHFKTLEGICLKALAKSPAERYATAEQFAADLTRWLGGQDFRVADVRFRRRLLVAGAAASVLLAAGGVVAVKKPWRAALEADLARADALLAEGKAEEALVLYKQVAAREKDNARSAEGRERALQKLREKPPPPPAVDPAPEEWKGALDILASGEVATDVVSGIWMREGAVLVSKEGNPALIQFPYRPSEEYDIRIEFVRQSGNFCVNLILSHRGSAFTLVMQRDGFFGFENVRGEDYHKNPTLRRLGKPLRSGRPHVVVVEVRKSGLKSFFEGQPVSEWSSYSDLTMNTHWQLPDPKAIGLGTWGAGASIKSLRVREITGKGERLR
jgi:tRNA A-37 threonylcarbamoyl transferase component Bud32